MNTDSIQGFLLGNVGAPFLIGLAVGYFVKKAAKTAILIGGLVVVILFVSEYYGFINIDGEGLKSTVSNLGNSMKTFTGFITERLGLFTSRGLSAGAGFWAGMKIG